ncbi:MAG: peptidylprolyl isomerase [Clostridia bacterium]|nr:peptidylprolyl isomerase [Clostridia bacterium]
MSFKKKMKNIVCATLASASVFAVATSFVGCNTSNPEVEMKISFNGSSYVLDYKLYRKIAPATVQHFIELADAKFYNGVCVHDYTSSKLYTGGYKVNEALQEQGKIEEINYFEQVKDVKLTQTVWQDPEKKNALDTVYGEFENNNFHVSSGALKQTYGSLTMFYTPKSGDRTEIYAKRSDGNGVDRKEYTYNSATSLFFIYTSTSQSNSDSYCTFATLKGKSKTKLDALLAAISDYIEDEFESSDDSTAEFAPSYEITTDAGDKYVGEDGYTANYKIPVEPIVIEYVKVTKY